VQRYEEIELKLNHVALTVSDRERSASFYSNYFGLTDRVHDDEHLLILAGPDSGFLAISEGPVASRTLRTSHFGFEVESVRQVRELRKRFKKDGIEEAEFQEHGPTRVQVFDPDGFRVEVYAWT
jgi:catechol 2,3-dioxygenase-like lactoylglutathione lyase family enzyme